MAEPPPRHLLRRRLQGAERRAVDPAESDVAQRLADLTRLVSDLVMETDESLNLIHVSARSVEVLGWQPWEMTGRPVTDFGRFADHGPQDDADPRARWMRPFRDRPFVARARDGSVRHLQVGAIPVFYAESEAFGGVRIAAEDVTRRLADEATLRTLSTAVEQSPVGVMITDRDGRIAYVNRRFCRTAGYAADELTGHTPALLASGSTPRSVYTDLWRTITAGKDWRGELHNRRRDGSTWWDHTVIAPVRDPDGTISHFVAIKEDVSERRAMEETLLRQAYQDEATELPNRMLGMDRLDQAVARARRSGRPGAFLFVDLDHFKRVNDVLGHQAADAVLREAGSRLVALLRPEDTVARFGGDEFGVVIENCDGPMVHAVAQRILDSFAEPFVAHGHELLVTASVGATAFPADGTTVRDLLRNADTALVRSKESGRNGVRFFTAEMSERVRRRALMTGHLRRAVERGEMALHYQPIVSLAEGRVVGAEALVRWTSPVFGPVSPGVFVPLAESTGDIVALGGWVTATASRQAADWRDRFGGDFRMAVNVSVRQMHDPAFVDTVLRALADAGLGPGSLEIEITESLLATEDLPVADALNRLRAAGVRVSIDDFGTGYASLAYLRRFPLDTLKIDRAFVEDLDGTTAGPRGATLVEAIVAMARGLGLAVVAEGVETVAQRDGLRTHPGIHAQGFLFGPPVAADTFPEVVASLEGRPPDRDQQGSSESIG